MSLVSFGVYVVDKLDDESSFKLFIIYSFTALYDDWCHISKKYSQVIHNQKARLKIC